MASENNVSNSPVPLIELNRIAKEACDSTLSLAKSYDHTLVSDWNSQIINKVLTSLIQSTSTPSSATKPTDPSSSTTSTTTTTTSTSTPTPPPYRFNVNSTIVQQSPPPSSPPTNGSSPEEEPSSSHAAPETGKRGMHSASGAYWDVKRDGMWTYKYTGAEEKGMDVVLSVIWFAMG